MGYALTEWVFTQADFKETSGGSAPVPDDDTGSLFAMTVNTADSPTIYTDVNGTTLTETNGVAEMNFSNGHVRFWTATSVTNLDISWIGLNGAGFLRNVGPGQHMLRHNGTGGPYLTAIPVQGLGANAATANTTTGVTPRSGVILTNAFMVVTSAGALASAEFDLGVSGVDNNGLLADITCSSVGFKNEGRGVLSYHMFTGGETISVQPSASHTAGAIAYIQLNYGNLGA